MRKHTRVRESGWGGAEREGREILNRLHPQPKPHVGLELMILRLQPE